MSGSGDAVERKGLFPPAAGIDWERYCSTASAVSKGGGGSWPRYCKIYQEKDGRQMKLHRLRVCCFSVQHWVSEYNSVVCASYACACACVSDMCVWMCVCVCVQVTVPENFFLFHNPDTLEYFRDMDIHVKSLANLLLRNSFISNNANAPLTPPPRFTPGDCVCSFDNPSCHRAKITTER